MMKRALAILLSILMLSSAVLPVSAESNYNDTTIDWGEHTTHIYDWCDDHSCNVCGALRDTDHVYDNACDTTCYYCGYVRPFAGHDYDSACDVDCNVCGAVRTVPHKYASCMSRYCSLCYQERENVGHVYDNATDADCNVCGELRNIVTIVTQPQSICVADGAEAVVTFTATGDDLTYQWYYAKKGSTTFYKTSYGVDTRYSTTMNSTRNGYQIYCVITDGYGNCVQTNTVSINMLPHTYTSTVTKAPTCSAAGIKTYTCSVCGDTYTESIAATGNHTYVQVKSVPSDCVNKGFHMFACSACEDSYKEYLPLADHTYASICDTQCNLCGNTRQASDHSYDHACDTECNLCGAIRIVPGHVYDNVCDANCNVCGALRQVADHVYDNGNDTDCNNCGFHRDACNHRYDHACDATCNVPDCGYVRPVGDHIYDNACDTTCNICSATRSTTHQYTPATCTTPKTCAVCGTTEGETLDHAYTSTVTKAPTCSATGIKTYTCSACSDSYTESIATLDHTWNAATCTIPKTCSVCGATEGEAAGHKYIVVSVAPSCTDGGKTTHTCLICKHSYEDGYTEALGHKYDAGTVTKKATCQTTGLKTYTCTVCENTKTETIAVSSIHTYVAATCTKAKTCKVCGKTSGSKLGHKYTNACDTKCNVCSATRSITHKYETVTKKATTSANGYTVKRCSVCDKETGKKTLYKVSSVTLSKTSYTYNGKVQKPTVTVKNYAGTKLTEGTSYTVTYSSGCKNAGTYKVTIKLKGNYSGTKTLTFKIAPQDVSKCKVTLSATSYTYDGKVKKPTVTVKNAAGTKLTEGGSYTVTYASGRKNVGTYKVTIKMKGNYTGTKTITFKILPAKTSISTLTAGTKKLTVKWAKKTTQVSGYQIQYSTSKSFSSYKTKTLTKNSTVSTALTGLSAKKTYYVRIRTYKTVNGVKIYSGWSTVKSLKTK